MTNAADNKELTSCAPVPHEELYLIREDAPPRSLLPGEKAEATKAERPLMLRQDESVEGVAGAGSIALDEERILGGWCSFCCQLAVPRRFAARAGNRLVEGAETRTIICELMRGVLEKLFSEPQWRMPQREAKLHKQLAHRLHEAAAPELISIGWRLTRCRLETIQITRREYS